MILKSDSEPLFTALYQIEELIQQGQWDKAQTALDNINPTTVTLLRMKGHFLGKILFMTGDYLGAIRQYEITLLHYGSHIGLICDLSFAFMLQGNYSKAYLWFKRVQQELKSAEPLININTLVRTNLFLAKMSFEWMEFTESIQFLKKVIQNYHISLNSKNWDRLPEPRWVDQATVQLLRYSAYLNLPESQSSAHKWQHLYGEVSLMSYPTEPRFILNQYHALLLADTMISGLEKSKLRLMNFINDGLFREDWSLGLSELLEILMLERQTHQLIDHQDLVELFLQTTPRDQYEVALQSLLKAKNLTKEIINLCLNEIIYDYPLNQYRLINILTAISSDNDISAELKMRLNMLLNQLSVENRALLYSRMQRLQKTDVQVIEVIEKNKLKLNSIEVKFKSNPLIHFLLKNMTKRSFVPIEDVVKAVWNVEYHPSYSQRIWVAIKRFNSFLHVHLNGHRLFYCKKEGIYLSEGIQLQSRKDQQCLSK